MIKLDFVKNKTYYVVGLGLSNRAVIKSLEKSGAEIFVWDDNEDNLKGYKEDMIRNPEKVAWSRVKAVVAAPSMPPHHPIVELAGAKNVPVIVDIELFAQSAPKTKIVGVTGTNGKSTTTALIHHILNADDKAQKGGNIGTPVLSLNKSAHYTVLELSSYQLERSPSLACDVAVLLNITPDHMEWHGDIDHYVASKAKIFNNATHKLIFTGDEYCRAIAKKNDSITVLDFDDLPFDPQEFPKLKGQHNLQNMLAAYHACIALGVKHDVIIDRMKSFEGLPHRQFVTRVINGVPYVNDSKATNADASKFALRAYKNIFWIAGGRPKEGGLEGIGEDLMHVKKAYLFGEARELFEQYLKGCGIDTVSAERLDDLIGLAHQDAQEARGTPAGTPCVMFSPACASFDQYQNFEERGDHFCDLVSGLGDV